MNSHQRRIYQMSKLCYLLRSRYPQSLLAQCTLQSTYRELKDFYKHASFEELRRDHGLIRELKRALDRPNEK